MIKNIILTVLLICFAGLATACNTAEGVGKDMERAGEKIQKESK